ncbi:hypothetical protein [Rhodococcus sp. P1Y]|uniref:hypothetical protein n=1 Tax=Rhodococcus sp. P1Y TaxID=1302308 RepID=UPI001F3D4EA8|nr:hypothetical protein [Rhodococcus sp. P1Y]
MGRPQTAPMARESTIALRRGVHPQHYRVQIAVDCVGEFAPGTAVQLRSLAGSDLFCEGRRIEEKILGEIHLHTVSA